MGINSVDVSKKEETWKNVNPFNAAHSESLTHLQPYEVALSLTQFVSLHDLREHLNNILLP